jgi:nitric oxide reductase activation protein
MEASYSTRMGAAMRHAAHYLEKQQADKKLMLILTDGEPSDIDSKDGRILIEDARQAVLRNSISVGFTPIVLIWIPRRMNTLRILLASSTPSLIM